MSDEVIRLFHSNFMNQISLGFLETVTVIYSLNKLG